MSDPYENWFIDDDDPDWRNFLDNPPVEWAPDEAAFAYSHTLDMWHLQGFACRVFVVPDENGISLFFYTVIAVPMGKRIDQQMPIRNLKEALAKAEQWRVRKSIATFHIRWPIFARLQDWLTEHGLPGKKRTNGKGGKNKNTPDVADWRNS